jgi:hypothetical protein
MKRATTRDIATYLASHTPPAPTLVLDATFPVVVGEKAWDALHCPMGVRR